MKRRATVISTEMIIGSLTLGSFIILTSLIGFLGFLKPLKRKGLLTFFIWLVAITLIVQLILGGCAYFNTLTIDESYSVKWRGWDSTLRSVFQEASQCCGYNDEMDFPAASPLCEYPPTGLPGCANAIHEYIKTYLQQIYIVLFSFTAIDVFAVLATLVVIQACRDEKRYEESKRVSQISQLTEISRMNLVYLQSLQEDLHSIPYV
ncbi:hypothetical protein K7432_000802 [Basidiobolus ranarum]